MSTAITNSAVNFQTKKSKVWKNATGETVPVNFVPDAALGCEILAAGAHKEAIKVEAALRTLHNYLQEASRKASEFIKDDFEIKKKRKKADTKGNITWYNFDRSLKIETSVQDIVRWDDAMMTEALQLLNEYINSSLGDANVLIKGLVTKAFANTKGGVDSGRVFQLLKYENQINDKRFSQACNILRQAQDIARSKSYMRVWEKMDNGEYRNINLNFSSL